VDETIEKIGDEGLRFSHSAEWDRGTPGEGDDTYETIEVAQDIPENVDGVEGLVEPAAPPLPDAHILEAFSEDEIWLCPWCQQFWLAYTHPYTKGCRIGKPDRGDRQMTRQI
jgi:hypothetical protein